MPPSPLIPEIGLLAAFGAGAISFFSPCVAPLVPAYLSYISGVSVQDLSQGARGRTLRVLGSSVIFVLGFALVFVVLGISASLFGGVLGANRRLFNQVAGGIMIVMGLLVMEVVRVPFFYQEHRLQLSGKYLGPLGPAVLGMVFAFGWTPCVGPILAAIILYTGAAETVDRGAVLLLTYSLGMGVPFVGAALGFDRALRLFSWVRRHYRIISWASGTLIIAMGLLFLTNNFFYVSIWAQRLYYALFY